MGIKYQILTRYFTSIAKQRYSILSSFVGLISSISISFFLIPYLSTLGAAIAFVIGSTISAFMMLWFFSINSKISIKNIIIPTKEDIHICWNSLSFINK